MFKRLKLLFIGLFFIATFVYGQVPVQINSGDPNFPFPQFLEYQQGKTLALYNAEGVTHADMEKAIREAYQVLANRFRFTGTEVDGVKYIRGNLGCPYDCAEGEGYAMLAAAYMGDKITFNGLWMRVHDDMVVRTPRYLDGGVNFPDYRHGRYTIKEESGDAAADGDMDIGLALLMATKQWGASSGVTVNDGNGGTKEMNYLYEAFHIFNDFVDTVGIDDGSGNGIDGYVTGHIGIDGYPKGGNTFGENTDWGQGRAINPSTEIFANDYNQDGFASYMAPAYYRSFAKFLEENGGSDWSVEQYKRAEAASEWIMQKNFEQGRLPFAGAFDVQGSDVVFKDGDPTQGKSDGEAFRMAWRTILNYLWRGDGIYQWNPVTHQYLAGKNTAMRDNAQTLSDFVKDPGICDALGASPDPVSTTVNHQGVSQIVQNILGDGTPMGKHWTNFTIGTSSPAVAAAGDASLIAQLYRQLELKWDDKNTALAEDDTIITESEPKYFHGWFRLLGMLTLTGNLHAPENMVAGANMKVYLSVDKTFAFVGDELTYTVSYRNYGALAATGVQISIPLPEQYEIVSTGGGAVSGGLLVYNVGTVPGFQSSTGIDPTKGSYTFKVRAKSPKVTDKICQIATITAVNGSGWTSNEYPNNASYKMQRNCADILGERSLKISKTASRTEVNPGMEVAFTLDFENSSDAGWLNGGRKHVNFSYAYAESGPNSYFHLFRNWNNADEAYIDLSNYRVSFFMFDNVNKGVYDASTNPTGWSLIGKNLQTGELADFQFKGESIPVGDDNGKKWNQRLIIQFPPDITAPTHTVLSHLNNRYQLHKGTLKPIWYSVQMEANPPAPLFDGRIDDDWSYKSTSFRQSIGSGAEPYFLIGPNYADPDNPVGVVMDRFDRDACTSFFGPDKIYDKVLVEEFDGYTWRRVAGEGPMPGREMYNVVVVDTLPLDFKFDRFTDDLADGIQAQLITSGGREIIHWTVPRVLVGMAGNLKYVAVAQGTCPGMADKDVINRAWIYSDTDSPLSAADTVKITCGFVQDPVAGTTMSKVADKTSYMASDDVIYTIDFEQTAGTRSIPEVTDGSRWTAIDGTDKPAFTASGIDFAGGTGSGRFITENFSHGKNGTLVIDLAHDGQEKFGIALRHTGGNRTSGFQGIFIEFELAYWGNQVNMSIYENTTATPIDQLVQEAYAAPFTDARIKIELNENVIKIWINDLEGLPFYTFSGLTNLNAGYVGFAQGDRNRSASVWSKPVIRSWNAHFDSAFEVQISDPLPAGLDFVSATGGGVYSGGTVTWPSIPGPMLYGESVQYTLVGSVTTCDASGKLINTAYVNLMGVPVDSLGAQSIAECGSVPVCTPPTIVEITPAGPLTICETETADLSVNTDAPAGYLYTWYRGLVAPGNAVSGPDPAATTFSATTAGDYIVVVADDKDPFNSSCQLASQPVTIDVTALVDAGTIGFNQEICSGDAPVLISATNASGGTGTITYTWQYSLNGSTGWTNLAASDNAGFTDVGLTADRWYRRQAESGTCPAEFSNIVAVDVVDQVPVSISIADPGPICAGDNAVFSTVAENAGASPSFQWQVNGMDAGTDSPEFSSSSLTDGDIVSVTLTSSLACVSAATVTSDPVQVTVSDGVIATVSVADPGPLCSGQSVTFTAAGNGGGATPSYEWYLNDLLLGETSDTYTSGTISNGDKLYAIMTSSSTCATGSPASSDTLVLQVGASVVPSVSLASQAPFCEGSMITLSAASSEEGATPSYTWYINGVEVPGESGPSLSRNNFKDGDLIKVGLTSSELCAVPKTVTSEEITLSASPEITPSVAIVVTSSGGTSVCSGEEIAFEVSSLSGEGSAPAFEWMVNGISTGITGNSFSSFTFEDKDSVSVTMTTDASCVTQSIVSSNKTAVSITYNVDPYVSIDVLGSPEACADSVLTFTVSQSENGGTNPVFKWLVNDSYTGEEGSVFTSNSLNNGDIVKVEIMSSSACTSSPTAFSNEIPVTIRPNVTPAVSISASAETICEGDLVNIAIASVSNEGGTPGYEWYLNGSPIPSVGNSLSWSSSDLVNNDEISVKLTSSEACVSQDEVYSNTIMISVVGSVDPSVSIGLVNPSDTSICDGNIVDFKVVGVTAGGSDPTYSWRINGLDVGATGNTFTASGLADGDRISVEMKTSSSCATAPFVESSAIAINVVSHQIPAVQISALTSTQFCEGGSLTLTVSTESGGGDSPRFKWMRNGAFIQGAEGREITVSDEGVYTVQMTSSFQCVTDSSVESSEIPVIVDASPDVHITASDFEFCSYESLDLSAITNDAITSYTWYFQTAEINASGPSYTASQTGSYQVLVTSQQGCDSLSAPFYITEIEVPEVVISPASASICEGETVDLLSSVSDPAYSYRWMDGENNDLAFSASSYSASAGSYKVVVDFGKCMDTSNTAVVTEQTLENPQISGNPQPYCEAEGEIYSVTENPGSSYLWTVPEGAVIVSGQGKSSIVVNFGTGSGTVSVRESLTSGCTGPLANLEISLQKCGFDADFTADRTVLCAGDTVVFTDNSTGDSPTSEYSWSFGPGADPQTASGPGPHKVYYMDPGDHSVSMTVNDGLSSEEIKPAYIAVHSNPVIGSVSGPASICAQSEAVYEVSNVNGASYTWHLPAGTVMEGNQSASVNLSFTDEGEKEISVSLTDEYGCLSDTAKKSVQVISAPAVTLSAPSGTFCKGESLTLTASGANTGSIYSWYMNDKLIDGETDQTLVAAFPGVYLVKAGDGGCSGESMPLHVSMSEFVINAGPDLLVEEGSSVQIFTSTSHPAITYMWTPQNIPPVQNPVVSPLMTTTYTVVASDSNGCSDSDDVLVEIVRPLFIPNAFTPNGDGIHDLWEIQGLEVYHMTTLHIYNRWGNIVFEADGNDYAGWDGTRNGELLPVATYYYVLDLGNGGEPLTGSVLLSK